MCNIIIRWMFIYLCSYLDIVLYVWHDRKYVHLTTLVIKDCSQFHVFWFNVVVKNMCYIKLWTKNQNNLEVATYLMQVMIAQ